MTRSCHFSFSDGLSVPVSLETYTYSYDASPAVQFTLNYVSVWPLSAVGQDPTLADSDDPNVSAYFSGKNDFLGEINPVLALGYMAAPKVPSDSIPTAIAVPALMSSAQCILTPCSRKYLVSVTNEHTDTEVLETDYGVMFLYTEFDSPDMCWRPKSLGSNNITEQDFTESGERVWCTNNNWASQIINVLNGTIEWSLVLFQNESLNTGYPRAQMLDPRGSDTFYTSAFASGGLPAVLPKIAAALTYGNLQVSSEVGNSDNLRTLQGTVYTEKSFVAVRWRWLALPAALNILGIVLLIVTAADTRRRRVPLWKSSVFAAIYHGLEDSFLDRDQSYSTTSDMEHAARETFVRLGGSKGGRRRMLVGS